MGRNLWETLEQRVRGGPMALTLFLVALIAFLIGCVLSWEDFVSSYYGILSLESAYGIQAVSRNWVRVVMAITPWVFQITFGALYTLDTDRKWALWAAVGFFAIDFFADVEHRSNGQMTGMFVPGVGFNMAALRTTLVSVGMTFVFFTIGAELALTASSAMLITLFDSAIDQAVDMRVTFRKAMQRSRDKLDGKQQDRQQQKKNVPPPQRPPQQQRDRGRGQTLPPPSTPPRRDTSPSAGQDNALLQMLSALDEE